MSNVATGGTVATGVFDGAMATTAIGIGNTSNGTQQPFGSIRKLGIWPVALSNSTLVSKTT